MAVLEGLSEAEGAPREEWCYNPDQPFEEGMTLVSGYLKRTGYRLPKRASACSSRSAVMGNLWLV